MFVVSRNGSTNCYEETCTELVATDLWRMVTGLIEKTLNTGDWLEAIALQDSMINERIESLITVAKGFSKPNTLDRNVKACLKLELMDDEIEVLKQIDAWREMRNKAMHRMVKYSDDNFALNWIERLQYVQACAVSGKSLVRLTSSAVARAKRRY